MSVTVFLVVLLAALLHACWNALVRGGRDRLVSMSAVVIGQAIFAFTCLPFVPFPTAESWPWIISSVALHLGYQIFLVAAYRTGGLTEVYPLARGVAPLIVALVSTVWLGAALDTFEWLGVILISCGLASFVIVRTGGVLQIPAQASVTALCAGVFIAAYSLNDGYGARLSGSGVAFFSWVAILNAATILSILPFWRPDAVRMVFRAHRSILLGGSASFTAYALVVWAFTQAPIATVTALRETSILFAMAIGVLVLGERMDLRRLLAAFLTLCGAVLLRIGRP